MDDQSTTGIDSIERFVFFVLHLSCFSFSTVSERVKPHKTIYSDNAAAAVVTMVRERGKRGSEGKLTQRNDPQSVAMVEKSCMFHMMYFVQGWMI
ncbi:hypothetical protein JOB18_023140 [Solea senegalensis]|uniref:Uncharacterized protein n=1 Tax=Solea senegalensis TaxID=28829 RepID=A0AAV6RIW7_SOLSE|nr:hypothetical protein JOB18_023140 [Solea senegalensis]